MINISDPYAVQKYDEQAARIEAGLQDVAPLLKWHVSRFDEKRDQDRIRAFSTFDVQVRGKIDGQEFHCGFPLSALTLEYSKMPFYDTMKMIAKTAAYEIARAILEWRPPNDRS